MSKILLILFLLLGQLAFAKVGPAKQAKKSLTIFAAVPGEYVVQFRGDIKKSVQNLQQTHLNASKVNFFFAKNGIVSNKYHIALIRTQGPVMAKEALETLKNHPSVLVAEPNYIYSLVGNFSAGKTQSDSDRDTPEDPHFSKLWGLYNSGENLLGAKGVAGADINALDAWKITKGDRRIKIAVIDTGIDYNHKDLQENIWVNQQELNGEIGVDDDGNGHIDDIHGYDFANNDGDPLDDQNHGTHVSGTIGALHNNAEGVAGVMGEVSLIAVKFLDARGSGSLANAIKAIDYASDLDVDIMSNSWGGGGHSQLLEDAIKRSSEKGIIFVAAAGNNSSNNDTADNYPANYPVENIISVGAHTRSDTLANFSCYGRNSVHVVAPGEDVFSSVAGGGYNSYSGTSMATPHVSGAIGLLLAQEGRMSHQALKERLMATVTPIRAYRGKTISRGRLNAFNLLTDTRPDQTGPNPDHWINYPLAEIFESDHPYSSNLTLTRKVTIPGAKYIRVVIKKYELENKYDFLYIKDGKSGEVVEKISAMGENYKTEYVEGDSVEIQMTSDYSVNQWGFEITELEYIMP